MEKKKINKKTFFRLIKFITTYYKLQLILVSFLIIISAFVSISASLFLKIIVDNYITPLLESSANPNFMGLYKMVALMACVFLVGAISTFIYSLIMVFISQGTLKKLRDKMFSHMQELPIRYFDQNITGNIMSVYTNDTNALLQMISQSIPQIVTAVITVSGSFIAMIVLSPLLAIITIILIMLLIFSTGKIGSKVGKYFMQQQQDIADVTGFIEEHINGQRVIKVFNHEEIVKQEFDKVNERLFNSNANANRYSNMMGPLIGNGGNIIFALTAMISGILFVNNLAGLTIGTIVSFLQFTRSFMQPIMSVTQQINSIAMAIAGAERIFNLIDEEQELDEGKITLTNVIKDENGRLIERFKSTRNWAWRIKDENGNVSFVELKGDIRFNDMTFGYNENKTILKNLTLYAKPGQKLAFVGATGAGKTTITNLINRFYDIQSGSITYDGIDVRDIKKSSLRKSLGIVLQDTNLFTGTIKDNIKYGKLNATDEEVYSAAKLANADSFINMLPDKYDTVITGNGEQLSQGQRQLLSIARAAIADPPVLILDEATSSIDTRTEQIVQSGMDNLMKGRTVFVIAHRLSTIRNSDAIIVLDQGNIIERGNHEDLIAKKGTYYQLYTGNLELD